MPINLLKKYPELLELNHLGPRTRIVSLKRVFKRDIVDNPYFQFREKQIRPIKIEGEPAMETLFHHLTTESDRDENEKKLKSRSFEMNRSLRLHWIKFHIEESLPENLKIFSYEDRIDGRDVIRTYLFDSVEKYVIILEPQRSEMDYYLLTAYYLDSKWGKKQINKKWRNRLEEVY